MEKILVLGAGGLGKECCYYLRDCLGPKVQIDIYADLETLDALIIGNEEIKIHKSYEDITENSYFIAAISDPQVKKELVTRTLQNGLKPAPTLIHPRAFVQNPEKIGVGGIIAPGVVVAASVAIGDYVLLNYNSTIGHDSQIGDFCTINPSVNISGFNRIGNNVFMGVGAVTKQFIKMGDGAICGAQACCLKDIPSGETVVGVPATRSLKVS